VFYFSPTYPLTYSFIVPYSPGCGPFATSASSGGGTGSIDSVPRAGSDAMGGMGGTGSCGGMSVCDASLMLLLDIVQVKSW
jgi:hypothetical protein